MSISVSPAAESTIANTIVTQQQGKTGVGVVAGNVEGTDMAPMTLQSLDLGPSTLFPSTFNRDIYATTVGKFGADASSVPLNSNPTPILSSILVGDGTAAAGQETGGIFDPARVGDISRQPFGVDVGFPRPIASSILQMAGPVPSNAADILPSIVPPVSDPLCETVEACLSPNLPARPRSSSPAADEDSGISNQLLGSTVDAANTLNEQLCAVKQIVAGVLREVIAPCSIGRESPASTKIDTTLSAVQENSVPGSSDHIPGNLPESEATAPNQFQAPGSPFLKIQGFGNVRSEESTNPVTGEVSGQSKSDGSSGGEAALKPPQWSDSGSWNGWNSEAEGT
ncbi:hypothetical protein G7Z17_g7033 [Cylindrodendrum hubeiense]|uniref:Uncharacterized protein n=1 Tax=Cylindrodendrum hubeiense TaxID=595255 RepID=A0A9P5HC51_9HYPO|nr:hypothetical protein G7Z17_g7033 [Cylindrodendrum hubeiense]